MRNPLNDALDYINSLNFTKKEISWGVLISIVLLGGLLSLAASDDEGSSESTHFQSGSLFPIEKKPEKKQVTPSSTKKTIPNETAPKVVEDSEVVLHNSLSEVYAKECTFHPNTDELLTPSMRKFCIERVRQDRNLDGYQVENALRRNLDLIGMRIGFDTTWSEVGEVGSNGYFAFITILVVLGLIVLTFLSRLMLGIVWTVPGEAMKIAGTFTSVLLIAFMLLGDTLDLLTALKWYVGAVLGMMAIGVLIEGGMKNTKNDNTLEKRTKWRVRAVQAALIVVLGVFLWNYKHYPISWFNEAVNFTLWAWNSLFN